MLQLAAEYHDGQYDNQGQPYILHPINVMIYLDTQDEELQCIALGHDLIEDTQVTEEHLYMAGMTKRVVEGILALTKIAGESYEKYKVKVLANEDAMRVKLCDLRHNMLPSRPTSDVKLKKYKAFENLILKKLNDRRSI
jgi:(p)ppGpp synthase/HD superfamily hydrolase